MDRRSFRGIAQIEDCNEERRRQIVALVREQAHAHTGRRIVCSICMVPRLESDIILVCAATHITCTNCDRRMVEAMATHEGRREAAAAPVPYVPRCSGSPWGV